MSTRKQTTYRSAVVFIVLFKHETSMDRIKMRANRLRMYLMIIVLANAIGAPGFEPRAFVGNLRAIIQ